VTVAAVAAGGGGFDDAVLVLGALLMVGALASGLARRSFLSLTALFVLAGFVLGHGGVGVLDLRASSPFVRDLAVVALFAVLLVPRVRPFGSDPAVGMSDRTAGSDPKGQTPGVV
jgi:hypothetical protein